MIANWEEEFAPHILARGKTYFEEGRVGSLQRSGNTYFADVAGTEEYEVEISIGEESVEEMCCSCPYAQRDHCKHMAAVLFALESEEIPVEELPPAKQPPMIPRVPMEMPWLEAIDHLPEAVVRKELMKRADREDWLKERLAVLYLGKLPEGQLQNWKADLQESARDYSDRRGRIQSECSWEFLTELDNFLAAKLPLLFEAGAAMDAFRLIWMVMETALEWEMDDEDDALDDLIQYCAEEWDKLLSMATHAQLAQMRQWDREHRNEAWPGGAENMDRVFHWQRSQTDSAQENGLYWEEP